MCKVMLFISCNDSVRDFVVNEIALDGSIVRLTTVTAPSIAGINGTESCSSDELMNEEDIDNRLTEYVGNDIAASMRSFIESPVDSFTKTTAVIDIKDNRTAIHKLIRHLFPHAFTTTTENRRITITKQDGTAEPQRGL